MGASDKGIADASKRGYTRKSPVQPVFPVQHRKSSVRVRYGRPSMRALSAIVKDYEWIHTGVGLVGNLSFVVGSVLFLSPARQTAGVWLFIFGSAFMFVGSAGDALVKWERDREGKR